MAYKYGTSKDEHVLKLICYEMESDNERGTGYFNDEGNVLEKTTTVLDFRSAAVIYHKTTD